MDENELKRLIWRSRRGLLELDLQLQHFVRETVPTLSCDDQVLFRDVLLLSDNDLLDYLNQKSSCPDARLIPMIDRIRQTQSMEL